MKKDNINSRHNNMRYFSNKQEKYIAKHTDGKVQPNSGATLFNKGDVIIKEKSILIEAKTKAAESQSITIKKEWFDKLKEEAFGMGLRADRAIVAINFGGNEKNKYIISEEFFKEILDLL